MDPNLQRLAGATLLWVGELAGSPRAPGAPPCRAKGQGNERLRGTFKETPSLQPLDRFRSLLVHHCGWSLLKASHQASLVLFKILPSPQSQSTPSIPGVRGLLIFSPPSFPVHHNPPHSEPVGSGEDHTLLLASPRSPGIGVRLRWTCQQVPCMHLCQLLLLWWKKGYLQEALPALTLRPWAPLLPPLSPVSSRAEILLPTSSP